MRSFITIFLPVALGGGLLVASLFPLLAGADALRASYAFAGNEPSKAMAAYEAYSQGRERFNLPQLAQQASFSALLAARQGDVSWYVAERALRDTLASHVYDPLGWGRLAYVLEQQGQSEKAVRALNMSVRTGPYLKGFMSWRLTLLFKVWDVAKKTLPQADQALLAQQAFLMWKYDRWAMIKLSRLGPFRVPSAEMMSLSADEASRLEFAKKQQWVKR